MSVRTVKYELEARLKSGITGLFRNPGGKLERKTYHDRGERLKISLSNLRVRDHSIAVVTADDVEIARIPIHRGSGRIDNESPDPGTLPRLEAGQTIEVRIDTALILSGKLKLD